MKMVINRKYDFSDSEEDENVDKNIVFELTNELSLNEEETILTKEMEIRSQCIVQIMDPDFYRIEDGRVLMKNDKGQFDDSLSYTKDIKIYQLTRKIVQQLVTDHKCGYMAIKVLWDIYPYDESYERSVYSSLIFKYLRLDIRSDGELNEAIAELIKSNEHLDDNDIIWLHDIINGKHKDCRISMLAEITGSLVYNRFFYEACRIRECITYLKSISVEP